MLQHVVDQQHIAHFCHVGPIQKEHTLMDPCLSQELCELLDHIASAMHYYIYDYDYEKIASKEGCHKSSLDKLCYKFNLCLCCG